MVNIRIEKKPAFNVIGTKTWIPGTDNAAFGDFWKKCHAEGDIEKLGLFRTKGLSVTNSAILGLSRTEQDPNVRSFYFYIAVETEEQEDQGPYEIIEVNPYRWAIFSQQDHGIDALMDCEMYAWMEWLPNNGTYIHDNGPEMEVYFQEDKVEYWIPVREK